MPFAKRPQRKHGFTLVELLVVVAIVGVLVMLLLPAVIQSRESARQTICRNNAKQIVLALLNYESNHQKFPIGATNQRGLGVSWLVATAPYLEAPAQISKIDIRSRNAGSPLRHAQHARLIDGVEIGELFCPSSPFSASRKVGKATVMMPSYVGLSGAAAAPDFLETRINRCCLPSSDGQVSGGGVLIPNQAIRARQIQDGMSKTLCIGETSDFAFDAKGRPQRIDGGFPLGWIAGTTTKGTPPDNSANVGFPSWNITTIRYTPNTLDYGLPGVDNNRGPNNPLVSPHPGGVIAGFCDGSVRFISESIAELTLKRMATRDDGGH